MKADRKFLPGV